VALKAVNTEATLAVVWPEDPSVEYKDGKTIDDYRKLLESGGNWRECLDVVDGEPTEFIVGVIPSTKMCSIDNKYMYGIGQVGAFWEKFLYGLRDIHNPGELTVTTTDPVTGNKVGPRVPTRDFHGVSFVDPEWLEKVMARKLRLCALFVGSIVGPWNSLGEDDAKK